MTKLISTGISSIELEKRRAEAHDSAILRIEHIKDMLQVYKLTKTETYDKMKETVKLIRRTHSFKLTSQIKSTIISNIWEALDLISQHELEQNMFKIDQDLKSIINYNSKIIDAKAQEKLDIENGVDVKRNHYKNI